MSGPLGNVTGSWQVRTAIADPLLAGQLQRSKVKSKGKKDSLP